jgi:hypothetical protein
VAIGISADGSDAGLEVHASGYSGTPLLTPGWAKARAAGNSYASPWQNGIVTVSGLSQIAGVITDKNIGWFARWNPTPDPYSLLIVPIGGAGAMEYVEDPRDGVGDSTDWTHLETNHDCRIVGLRFFDTEIFNQPSDTKASGRFQRTDVDQVYTFGDMADRVVEILEWIDANLNPLRRPIALIGSSGGADAVLSVFTRDSSIARWVRYLGVVSYPSAFWNQTAMCNEATPAGTRIDEFTGAIVPLGVGATQSGRNLVDDMFLSTACSTGAMTDVICAGSKAKDMLDGITPFYKATLHCIIGRESGADAEIVWPVGQVFNHPAFAGARRLWLRGTTWGHGEALTNIAKDGFTFVHAELAALADAGGSMSLQLSVAVRNARLDAIETVLIAAGNDAILEIRTGAPPANCAAADAGTVLATIALPDDPFAAAGSGSKAKSGTWQDSSADATGTAAHFRIKDHAGACHIQGTVTATGGGGDLTVDNVSFAAGQNFTVTGFTVTDGNA